MDPKIICCMFCKFKFGRKCSYVKHLQLDRCKGDVSKIEIYYNMNTEFDILNKENEILKKENNLLKQQLNIKLLKEKINIVDPIKEEKYIPSEVSLNIHKTLVELNQSCNGVYLALISDTIIKFGKTNCLQRRVTDHAKHFNRFEIFYFVRNIEHEKLEMILKNHQQLKPYLTTMQVNTVTHHELFQLNDKLSISDIKRILLKESQKLDKEQIYKLHNSCQNDSE
jgi:hypothetical protein